MGAVAYLDATNGTREFAAFEPAWRDFVRDKPHCNPSQSVALFRARMIAIEATQRQIRAATEPRATRAAPPSARPAARTRHVDAADAAHGRGDRVAARRLRQRRIATRRCDPVCSSR